MIKENDKLINKKNPEKKEIIKSDALKEVRVSPEALLTNAIKSGASVEAIEKLMNLRAELKKEYARDSYYKALTAFQSECPEIPKTKIVREKDGITVRYKYAPLEIIVMTVRSGLEKHGFSYSFKTSQNKEMVTASCMVSHKDGHSECTEVTIPYDHGGYMNAAQRVGSALTYAKRYAFIDAFGIVFADSDDDGQTAGEKKETIQNENTKVVPVNVNELPIDNQILYKNIMSVLNQKNKSGEYIFIKIDRMKYKTSADLSSLNLEQLKKIYETLNKIAEKRSNQ